ncbi:MAG: hypothetical protein IJU76_13075 [Desulfovibrionaceae bacterium]|nr:hypothetical protein [Desulfovibrionaceae bacterium]
MRLNHLLHINEYPLALRLIAAQNFNQCIGLWLFKLLGERNVQIVMTEVMSESVSPVHVRSFMWFNDERLNSSFSQRCRRPLSTHVPLVVTIAQAITYVSLSADTGDARAFLFVTPQYGNNKEIQFQC